MAQLRWERLKYALARRTGDSAEVEPGGRVETKGGQQVPAGGAVTPWHGGGDLGSDWETA
ncbi:hypothetical protein CLAFUW4_12338 [Fulvia fulva]|uniref:Uncharacterized protein n=1 Tax=Passalora fulva TaxID=5499 RepID=A0A9Q8PED5_PASFU|nr:uncharacterized protein CLAFUR5_11368 [Fulvia fulva]KAK4618182.1 hypothetical protein CLAFUR4_12343 [Fulvia fulva]KAK4618841.1 hypothetical protein CLAFUR0_12354 [Fulvia fulva]UJO20976.1 hypothetical protein CLAFUR5_11368 [Fulvia fulva]WPV17797.1 hypothetical protein CLAFUW4_12338 [Fulvia fulva]WPV33455.1 hypothetical protein CLAFUW7_12345 [Fulvia fulva]